MRESIGRVPSNVRSATAATCGIGHNGRARCTASRKDDGNSREVLMLYSEHRKCSGVCWTPLRPNPGERPDRGCGMWSSPRVSRRHTTDATARHAFVPFLSTFFSGRPRARLSRFAATSMTRASRSRRRIAQLWGDVVELDWLTKLVVVVVVAAGYSAFLVFLKL